MAEHEKKVGKILQENGCRFIRRGLKKVYFKQQVILHRKVGLPIFYQML